MTRLARPQVPAARRGTVQPEPCRRSQPDVHPEGINQPEAPTRGTNTRHQHGAPTRGTNTRQHPFVTARRPSCHQAEPDLVAGTSSHSSVIHPLFHSFFYTNLRRRLDMI
ncbi:hypothetical protein G6O67_008454 [Ophiocordyceps sinensis]|uniref:Uncharacterized protein n=1 Tax=Ophiocordyceps sinensis TaxID=72228 RepID=A0A8H4LSR8_9HYPO|nr:hypothetical protein G6O67_008454 [Ophiocordyceps sinensis]